MAVRAHFIDGPLDGEWKAMQDVIPEIKVAKRDQIDWDRKDDIKAVAAVVQGTYAFKTAVVTEGGEVVKAWYRWQGWDDELQEVQESEER